MSRFYIAVSVSENGGDRAYVISAAPSDNLLAKLRIKGCRFANLCHTKREANELADAWNTIYSMKKRQAENEAIPNG